MFDDNFDTIHKEADHKNYWSIKLYMPELVYSSVLYFAEYYFVCVGFDPYLKISPQQKIESFTFSLSTFEKQL